MGNLLALLGLAALMPTMPDITPTVSGNQSISAPYNKTPLTTKQARARKKNKMRKQSRKKNR